MKNVIHFPSYSNASRVPTLVFLDLQQEYIASPRLFAIPDAAPALEKCQTALTHARRAGLPVAFFRMIGRSPFFNPALSYSNWIPGFEPQNSDMVFQRDKPSCYANREFAHAMTESGGHFVLAGFAGEAACLATVMEAFHRNHHVTFLADASASHGLDRVAPRTVHETVVQLIKQFGSVTTTDEWIAQQNADVASWAY